MDPVYITGAPKTFVLKFCIGLITGLVAHKIAKINESTDKKYVFKWSVIASVAGLAFNVVADPIVGYFYKQYILGQPQELAQALAKMSACLLYTSGGTGSGDSACEYHNPGFRTTHTGSYESI